MALAHSEPEGGRRSVEEPTSHMAEVMEEALHRVVHLRGSGGGSGAGTVVLAEAQYEEVLREVRAVLTASKAIGMPGARRRPDLFGDDAWLMAFDDEDLASFVEEMGQAILDALGTGSGTFDGLRTLGQEWRTTAAVLADPVSRGILLGRQSTNDFTEVSRPA